jgi:hypothetical protein
MCTRNQLSLIPNPATYLFDRINVANSEDAEAVTGDQPNEPEPVVDEAFSALSASVQQIIKDYAFDDEHATFLARAYRYLNKWVKLLVTFKDEDSAGSVINEVFVLNGWIISRWRMLWDVLSFSDDVFLVDEQASDEQLLSDDNALPINLSAIPRSVFIDYLSYLQPKCHTEMNALKGPPHLLHPACPKLPTQYTHRLFLTEKILDFAYLSQVNRLATYLQDKLVVDRLGARLANCLEHDLLNQQNLGRTIAKWFKVLNVHECDEKLVQEVFGLLSQQEQQSLNTFFSEHLELFPADMTLAEQDV